MTDSCCELKRFLIQTLAFARIDENFLPVASELPSPEFFGEMGSSGGVFRGLYSMVVVFAWTFQTVPLTLNESRNLRLLK